MDICNIKIISLMLVCLLSINFVLALGVSSPYWKDNPLEMYPGETKEVKFSLVNRPDAETAQAFVFLEDGVGVAEITSGTEYTVTPGTTNTKVILQVTIPDEANIGDSYDVKFSVKSVPEDEGMVQLTVGYNVDFPVVVVGKPTEIPKEGLGTWQIIGIVIGIIAILVIIYLILKKLKRK